MSGTWKTLVRLTEASEKDALLSYIQRAYGDHHYDEVKPFVDSMWNPEDLDNLHKTLAGHYSDPKINDILTKAAQKMGAASGKSKTPLVKKRAAGSDVDPTQAKSAVGGPSRMDRIAGLQSGDYVNPSDFEKQRQQTAATAASRPDRAGTTANTPAMAPTKAVPGERPTHDVGTAGQSPGSMPGHTRPVQKQVSQTGGEQKTVGQQLDYLQGLLDKDPEHPQKEKIQKAIEKLTAKDPDEPLSGSAPVPTSAGSDLESLRTSIEQMKKRQMMLVGINGKPGLISQMAKRAVGLKASDPAKSQELARQANQMRAELNDLPKKIRNAEASISRTSKIGKSGVNDAQRQVDDRTDQYGEERGAALAKKLGVPPTKARETMVTDPDTGKQKRRRAIWSAEKIQKWQSQGPELKPGVYDLPGKDKLPDETNGGGEKAPSHTHKPMMKAPKGLTKDGLQQLADLRRQFSKLKKSGAGEDELALLRQEINTIMAKGGEMEDVVMPGAFAGQVWTPSGVSQDVKSVRPDKATGKVVYGKRTVGPEGKGQSVVWDPEAWDWVLPSQHVSKAGEKNAAELDKTDRPWASTSADDVPGNRVPKDANSQKAAAFAEPAPKKGPTVVQKHRGNKDAIKQAFFGKKGDEPEAEAD